jgi:hypothetical protein
MIVAHQVVVLCLRYIIEDLDEKHILAIDAEGDVANCAVTSYRFMSDHGPSGGLMLDRYNETAPGATDAVSTSAPDTQTGFRA